MTKLPHSVGKDQTLDKAEELMNEYHIRHLPVLDAGNLVGVITDRDIKLAVGLDFEAKKTRVSEVFTPEPFAVGPEASLAEVCREMHKYKYGCALVVNELKLVGIFTWVDAVKVLADLSEKPS